ncbi:hypothetical protein [Pseudoduganella umbonata]|uniref:Uncharacterized protein n=1 Tax=Pseudoduganella umbonata TaxID=864828 RepID=A0A4P8HL73_9BURK|nr:hypothetical protein [Pseudoduganella umbonata]MBB3221751.1 hypothetical protein [Pseudoduganella umbonata]QCP09030.1 hypothetical protein FCL38_00200 [Pseudoduganella umbonata]
MNSLPTLLKRSLATGAVLLATAAAAAPAPWWLWESVTGNGAKVCSQTPLGPGWRKLLGPYKDSRCEKLIRVQ